MIRTSPQTLCEKCVFHKNKSEYSGPWRSSAPSSLCSFVHVLWWRSNSLARINDPSESKLTDPRLRGSLWTAKYSANDTNQPINWGPARDGQAKGIRQRERESSHPTLLDLVGSRHEIVGRFINLWNLLSEINIIISECLCILYKVKLVSISNCYIRNHDNPSTILINDKDTIAQCN